MKTFTISCLIALCTTCSMAQDLDTFREQARIVPIVNYIPMRFLNEVHSSFHFNDAKPCYFIKKDADKSHGLYWYDDSFSYGQPKLQEITVDLPLSPQQDEILRTRDSVFIFSPVPRVTNLSPLDIEYIGYINDGRIYYASKDRVYDRLDDFLTQEFGSTANFRQRYLNALDSTFDTLWSGLYVFENDNEAINFLKDNYKFMAVTGKGIDEILPQYLKLLKSKLYISPSKESRLTDILRKSYDNDDQNVSDFLAGRKFDVFDAKFLRSVLSNEEYGLIENTLSEESTKMMVAYLRLLSNIPNIDKNGSYYIDRDKLKIIAGKVFSAQ